MHLFVAAPFPCLASRGVTSVIERIHKDILLTASNSYTRAQKEPLMKRSIGVTFSAIVSLLGSALTLGLGALLIFILFFFAPTRANFSGVSSAPKAIFVIGALVYILPAIWGVISSIGLFLLKNWARISILIFSVILILMGALVGIIMLFMPLPAAPAGAATQSTMTGIRLGMGGFWFGIAGIGVWWLILFTRRKVKAQFTAPSPAYSIGAGLQPATPPLIGQSSARPLSITIIAWLLLVGCAFFPINFLIHAPAIFFTKLVTGYAAALYLSLYFVANLSIGIGLLRLNPATRIAAIAYYVFAIFNIGTFYFAPGGHDRMQALVSASQAMFPWTKQMQQSGPQFDPMPFMTVFSVIGVLGILIPLYFLITRKQAFAAKKEALAI
jgi:hypothetical protein